MPTQTFPEVLFHSPVPPQPTEFAMKTSLSFPVARRMCLSLLTAAALAVPMASHAQAQAQEITYLLPAPGTLPAFGPWMLAQAKGYYEQEGLKVNFVAARGGVDVAKQIGAGKLTQLVSHKDEKIESPRELKGRTVTGLAYTDTTYYALLGMLSKVGLTKNDVNIQAAGPAGVWQQFAGKKATAMAGVPDWTVSAMEAGAQVDILPADVYFKSMAQAILASDDTIQKNPQLVQKLVRATLKGMKDIMADPKGATVTYVAHVPAHKGKEASIQKAFEMFNQYVYSNQKVPGTMDEARLTELQKFYVSNGVVPKETPVKELYTNQFVTGK